MKKKLHLPAWLCIQLLLAVLFVGNAWAENVDPIPTISKAELSLLQENWDTDGYWYFYAKNNKKSLPVLSYLKQDGSDVLLVLGESGIWINAKRPATPDELAKTRIFGYYADPAFRSTQSVCDKVKVRVESHSDAHHGDFLGTRIVISDLQGNELQSFAIFRKLMPPQVLKGYLSEDHEDQKKPLTIPISSAAYAVAALSDCTFLAKLEDGVARFKSDGTTQAQLRADMRLVSADEVRRMRTVFDRILPIGPHLENYGDSLQPRLWFFYRNLFEGEQK